jgi:hypothetical protein
VTFAGWFSFAGQELVNNERTRGLAESHPQPVWWYKGERFPTVQEAFDPGLPYSFSSVDSAPWYDPTIPASADFFGAYVLTVKGIKDSTRGSVVTESVTAGGVLGKPRRATKAVTFQAQLLARSREALEYGQDWLSSALEGKQCGQHGSFCGLADLTYLTDVPPRRDGISDSDYEELLTSKLRYLHDVGLTSGPFTVSEQESKGVFGVVMEWTLISERPYVFTATRPLRLPPALPEVVQDIPYNRVPYPSMELSNNAIIVTATNYALNPSVESGITSWQGASDVISGTAPTTSNYLSLAQSSDIAADRTNSARVRVLGNGTSTASGRTRLSVYQRVAFPTNLFTDGLTRCSVSIWGAVYAIVAPTGTALNSLGAKVTFRNASNVATKVVELGAATAAEFNGRLFAAQSLVVPVDTTSATVEVYADISYVSASAAGSGNSDVRLYADALAVTVP